MTTTDTTPHNRLPIAIEGTPSRGGGSLAPGALVLPDEPVPVTYGFAGDHTVVGEATGWERHSDGVISAEISFLPDATFPGWALHHPSLEVIHFQAADPTSPPDLREARPVGVAILPKENMGWPTLVGWVDPDQDPDQEDADE